MATGLALIGPGNKKLYSDWTSFVFSSCVYPQNKKKYVRKRPRKREKGKRREWERGRERERKRERETKNLRHAHFAR